MDTEIVPSAVNAWSAGNGDVIVAIRVGGKWETHRITADQAVQLADQLRLLTKTTD